MEEEEDGSEEIIVGGRAAPDAAAAAGSVGEDLETSPVARNRANTWHGPPKVTPKDDVGVVGAGDGDFGADGEGGADGMVALGGSGSAGAWRKGAARRNAWGNLSYADLITKAIESSPDKRMTLSQIYGWMVQNISFFKDKGESNSSAGWKNSIRHNLSLHNRFMRVQNEGTGKSSWWMINSDAKAVKIPRRRAATMDAKTYTGKRSRVQRAVSINEPMSSDLQSKTDEHDDHDMNTDYQRISTSNGVTLGLSHMQPVTELEDAGETEFVPPSSSWTGGFSSGENFAETLSESLADIFVGNLIKEEVQSPEFPNCVRVSMPSASALQQPNSLTQSTFMTRNCPIMHPVISSRSTFSETYNGPTGNVGAFCNNLQMFGPATFSPTAIKSEIGLSKSPDATCRFANSLRPTLPTIESVLHVSNCNVFAKKSVDLLQSEVADKVIKAISPSDKLYNQFTPASGIGQVQPVNAAPMSSSRPLNSQFLLQLLANKPQLVAKMQHLIQMRQQQQQQQQLQQQQLENSTAPAHAVKSNPVASNRSSSMLQQLLISSSDASRSDPHHLYQVPTLSGDATSNVSTFIPADLDLNFHDFDTADIDCDIDQVIKHELTFGENLDFAFDRSTDV